MVRWIRACLSVDVPTRVPVLPQLILLFQREEISSDKSALSRLKTFHTTDGDHKVQIHLMVQQYFLCASQHEGSLIST
ncbi:hypothetical protein AV530_002209 [Patagioenas fasciata monilis]|uniref:Uncharacterized protein n=1 Tax=Patagioenas fasciata monilis TaxID=372326 RepID=A0A1V4K5R8_PATFA|nr:hypothetical protein AV530_002209 [Patagioenas fasciata monilis]